VYDTAQSRENASNFEATIQTESSHTRRGVHIGYLISPHSSQCPHLLLRDPMPRETRARQRVSQACIPCGQRKTKVDNLTLHTCSLGTTLTVPSHSVMARFLRAISV
jgi:hypothetical protein